MRRQAQLPRGLKLYTKNDLNVEWDLFVQGALGRWIKELQSYNNVYNTVERLYRILIRLQYRVGYGYIKINEKEYLRSSFLLRDDYVIDTARHFYREITEMEYITFKEYDIQDYILAVIKNEGETSLGMELREQEIIWKWYAKEEGIRSIL